MSALSDPTVDWLLEGDPVIRWQTMRDLQGVPEAEWQAERRKTLSKGWVHDFLALQGPDGHWKRARWTGDIYTLLTLIDCGMPADDPRLQPPIERFLDELLSAPDTGSKNSLFMRIDQCHLGFWLRIGAYFRPWDTRLPALARRVLELQFADGGWNCRIRNYSKTTHSSFHTTFNILEGLRAAAQNGIVDAKTIQESEARALEFMLQHRLYKSDRTGGIISERFLHLSFPSYWHYNVLRGLDYIAFTPQIKDPRLTDALEYLQERRLPNGRWPVEKRIPGATHFDMDPMGKPSRWNTLRASRALLNAEAI